MANPDVCSALIEQIVYKIYEISTYLELVPEIDKEDRLMYRLSLLEINVDKILENTNELFRIEALLKVLKKSLGTSPQAERVKSSIKQAQKLVSDTINSCGLGKAA